MADEQQPAQAACEPEGWRPTEGETITGEVVELSRGWSDYRGRFYPIVTIKRDDGSVSSVHAFHSVLERLLGEARPKIGERVSITFVGVRETRDGKRSAAIYRLQQSNFDADRFWGTLSSPRPTSPDDEADIPF